jgi:hypothetical protein
MMIELTQFPDQHRLTNSQIGTFRTCQRREYYSYRLGVRPEGHSKALRFGTMMHFGIELHAKGMPVDDACRAVSDYYNGIMYSGVANPRDIEIEHMQVVALLNGYFQYWRGNSRSDIGVVHDTATERQFELKVPYQKWVFAGKIDGIVALANGQAAIRETKTTSEDMSPESDYVAKLRIDNQISGYVLAAKSLGFQIDTILYDIIKKPGIRPLSATPEESRKYTKEGKLYANQRETDESASDYYDRLWADITTNPDKYYARYNIPRTDDDLNEWREEIIDTMKEMQVAYQKDRKSRNTSACLAFGRCPYLDVCHSGIQVGGSVPPSFRKVEKIHEELE